MSATFLIVTFVTRPAAYDQMRASMSANGYDDRCRFVRLDNSTSNAHEPYAVLRELPADGDEPYVVLCHQDLQLGPESSCDQLLGQIAALDRLDPRWAVAGTAGVDHADIKFLHLTDPGGTFRAADLPHRVLTLDENFLLFPRSRFPAVSRGIAGFHFYAADVCLHARLAGHTSYVIDLPLTHFGAGDFGADFQRMKTEFADLWRPHLLVGVWRTTCCEFRVSRWKWLENALIRNRMIGQIRRRRWNLIPFPGHRRGPA